MRCAKFCVVVFKAPMLDCGGGNLPWVYVYCAIYMKHIWCNGCADIYV